MEGSYILRLLRNVSMSRAAAYGLEGPGVSLGSTPSGSGAVYTHTHTPSAKYLSRRIFKSPRLELEIFTPSFAHGERYEVKGLIRGRVD